MQEQYYQVRISDLGGHLALKVSLCIHNTSISLETIFKERIL